MRERESIRIAIQITSCLDESLASKALCLGACSRMHALQKASMHGSVNTLKHQAFVDGIAPHVCVLL